MKRMVKRTKERQQEWNIIHGHDLPTVKARKRRAAIQAIQKKSRRKNR